MKLRLHQKEILNRSIGIVDGSVLSTMTVMHACPGAGKSKCVSLMAKTLLDANLIDTVAWICPRISLTSQAVDGFKDYEINSSYSINRNNNKSPLVHRGIDGVGYSTTYQAVAANPNLHHRELGKHKYLLVLDEPHHLQDDKKTAAIWTEAISPLVKGAFHTLLMTGTIERHDNKMIPFIPYDKEGDVYFPRKDIVYTRYDALMEEAIVPIEFAFETGWVKFEDDLGIHHVDISTAEDDEVSKVIQTFLGQTEFRDRIVRRGITEWLEYRKTKPCRAIVICARQDTARVVADKLMKDFSLDVSLAISDDANSQQTVRDFRKGKTGEVLVTVGMAYEGLDVPDCKFLICLTNIRSLPWLEQAFARVTRVDYKAVSNGITYKDQIAKIYVPDDPRMKQVVKLMMEEQDKGVTAKKHKKPTPPKAPPLMGFFTPMVAESSGSKIEVVGTDTPIESNSEISQESLKMLSILIRRRDHLRRLKKGSTLRLVISKFKSGNRMGQTDIAKAIDYLEELIRTRQ